MSIKILIANRGEIALRILKTCRKLGFVIYSLFTEADQFALNVKEADHSILLPSGPLSENYLNATLIVENAIKHNITAIHPGYGFLSQSCDFAQAIEAAGIIWIGPTIQNIKEFASKHHSKILAKRANVPILPSTFLLKNVEEALMQAQALGYPVMIKGSDTGGGIGMFKCKNKQDVLEYFPIARQKSISIFGSDSIFLEKLLDKAHHIEIQIVGDGKGNVYDIGERECSAQRRHQKVIEETPSPFIDDKMRVKMIESAVSLAKSIKYKSLGTVEFIVDHESRNFYFLEVNTRLQVEHPITEMTFEIDLVETMINIALGRQINWDTISQLSKRQKGHAIEVRIYAENPIRDYKPSAGRISYLEFPKENETLRIDTWIEADITISPNYDPLLGKMISYGQTREAAVLNLLNSLNHTIIQGVETNIEFLYHVVKSPIFNKGINLITSFLDNFKYTSYTVEIIEPGLFSLIQDFPGRVGYWDVGIPPSGPMDPYSFQIANYLVGNSENEAGIEILLDGMTLKFNCNAIIALAGAQADIMVDKQKKSNYESIYVPAGSEVQISLISTVGCRAYLAIKGGIQIQNYLGSKSTFPAGKFGGLNGNPLQAGDFLHICEVEKEKTFRQWPKNLYPEMTNEWIVLAMGGPHGAPDYFTDQDIKTLWSYCFTVNHNANRLGIRLNGYNPKFAREDGGDAGLHPSNVHDYAYAIGCLNFSGNTPIILTPDGPSLGGFVCPLTVIQSEMWKIGQLRAGDKVYFKEVDYEYAISSKKKQEKILRAGNYEGDLIIPHSVKPLTINPIIKKLEKNDTHEMIRFRSAGEMHILCDFYMGIFGLENRFLVEKILRNLKQLKINGLLELIPGVSSLLIKYDCNKILNFEIINLIQNILISGKSHKNLNVPCRRVSLPLAFQDKWTLEAIKRYQKTIRSEAPYLPDNCQFIKTINSLQSLTELSQIIQNTTYLVLGLGDVYLGAPCAVPIDPRHRIVTTKYDPARTYTPEGGVGIGGIYMCIYGMDSPGGYQLVGRSLPIWYSYNSKPWLLDFFDQINFYLVSNEELQIIRKNYRIGKMKPKIEDIKFSYCEYMNFLQENKESIENYEKEHTIKKIAGKVDWTKMKNAVVLEVQQIEEKIYTQKDGYLLKNRINGNLYEIKVEEGNVITVNQQLMLIQVMKMSISVLAPVAGIIKKIVKKKGTMVLPGDILCIIEEINN